MMRAAILDDEPLAREGLRTLLSEESDVDLVGEYRSGATLLREINVARPDVLFADIEMPALSGFDVTERIRRSSGVSPFVVFVTAFHSYAIRAFDVEATDFLLKPFDRERFSITLDRVRRRLAGASSATETSLSSRRPEQQMVRVAIRHNGTIRLVRVDEVDWIESAGNYVRLHHAGETHLLRDRMVNLEQRLDPNRFVRIHRFTIVNVDRIIELLPSFARDYLVLLKDGTRLRLSANFHARLDAVVDGL